MSNYSLRAPGKQGDRELSILRVAGRLNDDEELPESFDVEVPVRKGNKTVTEAYRATRREVSLTFYLRRLRPY